ncbi:calcium-binding protein [Anabaena sp. WFMT]|uniref:calcium-binding protein n=1 Tax=Anabaena sp. WFMT TaxID=3449730 RepID=UPI003F21ECD6
MSTFGTYTGDEQNNIFTAPNDGSSWVIYGEGGDDILTGGTGDDTINGDEGNDTITGGEGYDYLSGGEGDDLLVDTQGNVNGGGGTDTLRADYSQFDNGFGVHVGYAGYNIIFSRRDASGLLTYSNIEKFDITGTKYDDVLQGAADSDTLRGGGGNDEINGAAGYDYLFGGDGNDVLIDTEGNIDGGAGTDILVADYSQFNNGAGIDVGYSGQNAIVSSLTYNAVLNYSNIERFNITGTQYADILRGGSGDDTLNGAGGNDQIIAGAGNDIVIDTQATIDGGVGVDTLVADYSLFNNGAGIDVQQNAIFSRQTGNFLLGHVNVERFNITGTQYDDILRGGASDDTLSGGAGNDTLIDANGTVDGGAGIDTLVADYTAKADGAGIHLGWNGSNNVFSRVNGQVLVNVSNIEKYNITGSQYQDVFEGRSGNDIFNGGAGNDIFYGDAGNDTLIGGTGNDTLYGGVGADSFVFNSSLEGLDVIKDFSWAQGDKIQISTVGFGVTNLNSFSYNDVTGGLFFQGTQLATLENKPVGFSISLDVQLV